LHEWTVVKKPKKKKRGVCGTQTEGLWVPGGHLGKWQAQEGNHTFRSPKAGIAGRFKN